MKILIVDDDKNFLLSLYEGLSSHYEDHEIITAENGQVAVEKLKNHEIGLVVTDLKMPQMDGFALLAYISSNYSRIPVIGVTAFGTPDIKHELLSMGMFLLLEKPISFKTLLESINKAIEAKSDFLLNEFSLATFLQLIELEEESATLLIKSNDKNGYLFIKKGKLLDAETKEKTGKNAFCEILSWDNPEIRFKDKYTKTKNVINTPIKALLQELNSIKQNLKENKQSNKNKWNQKEENMITEDQLAPLTKIVGFLGAAVYTSDGQLVISSSKDEHLDIDNISALAVELFRATKNITEGMQLGVPETITVKTEGTYFIHHCIITGVAGIGIVLAPDGNVGLSQLTLRKLANGFKPIFSDL